MTKPLVMIVEDEMALVTMLRYNLEKEGFDVCEATDGEEAILQLSERQPNAVLLDWMLPQISGIEICRQIRRAPSLRNTPVLMLTARADEGDKIRGLNSGADDYITKPFSPSELIARLRAVMRRSNPSTAGEILMFEDIKMDLIAHRVSRGNEAIHVGPTEYKLLRFFMEHPRRVYSREQLLDAIWGHDVYVEPRTVDVHIRRLRKALTITGENDFIRTVRSAGYAMDTEIDTSH